MFVPNLLDGEWPVREQSDGLFPRHLLREAVPPGDIHTDEERRLLYVAMTRAQDRLILTTHGGSTAQKQPSRFVAEITDGAGPDVRRIDRTGIGEPVVTPESVFALEPDPEADDRSEPQVAAVRRVMPLPSARERRLALRLRASELVGLMEATDTNDAETPAARDDLVAELASIARSVATTADQARAQGLDPLTFRDDRARRRGRRQPPPGRAAATRAQLLLAQQVRRLPAPVRVQLRLPDAAARGARGGVRVRDHGPRRVRGVHQGPARAHRARGSAAHPRRPRARVPGALDPDRLRRQGDRGGLPAPRRDPARQLLERRSQQPQRGPPRGARVRADPRARRRHARPSSSPARSTGSIACPRAASKSSTTRPAAPGARRASTRASNCRSTRSPAGMRSGLGAPERVTLYFTESALRLSTTRSDEQLDLARADVLARVARMRAGEFAATPSAKPCEWCDYRAMCPERV